MTGKGHYEQAERLLAQTPKGNGDQDMQVLVAALAHAALSLIQAQLAIATTGIPSSAADSIWLNWGEQQ